MKKKMEDVLPGIILCLIVAIIAWFLGKALPIIGGPVFGILLGMMAIMLIPSLQKKQIGNATFGIGIKYTSKKLLQYSIILLGFQMNLFYVIEVGKQSLQVILATLTSSFLTAFMIGKLLKLSGKMTSLVGVGTSICGGSAIAATAPVIQAEDEEVAQAISTIFLFNILAVFIFPYLGVLLNLSDIGFGMWAGTAINDTSSVVAASSAWSAKVGNDTALEFATIVKLNRTLMIVPITLVLAIYTTKKNQSTEGVKFSFVKVFPWFVIGFITAAIINTFLGLSDQVTKTLVSLGKFMIVMAMVAIGLNTNLKKLLKNGIKPIILGLCCWFSVAFVSLVIQKFIGLW